MPEVNLVLQVVQVSWTAFAQVLTYIDMVVGSCVQVRCKLTSMEPPQTSEVNRNLRCERNFRRGSWPEVDTLGNMTVAPAFDLASNEMTAFDTVTERCTCQGPWSRQLRVTINL